jgi:hypothetical protein
MATQTMRDVDDNDCQTEPSKSLMVIIELIRAYEIGGMHQVVMRNHVTAE